MNFEVIPELHWPFGYPLAVLLMIVSALGAYVILRRNDWI